MNLSKRLLENLNKLKLIKEGYNIRELKMHAKQYPDSYEILSEGRLNYRGITVSWVNYLNPENIEWNNNWIKCDCSSTRIEYAIEAKYNRPFSDKILSPSEIKERIKSIIDAELDLES